MKGMIHLIKIDGTVESKKIITAPDIEELQAAVGGFIEVIPAFDKYKGDDAVAFCNEEGKLEGLLPNLKAQELWEEAFGSRITNDHLVGDIIVITGDESLMQTL